MLEQNELEKQMNGAIDWIKQYVKNIGKQGVVIGNSGGKDSACAIAMAVKALGANNVVTVSMPCNSIQSDFEDAKLVANTFGVRFIKIDLSNCYDELEDEIQKGLELIDSNLLLESKINIKPRIRMTTLYAVAQSLDYLVMGTGNLCEAMVGYTTKWGDSGYDFNPIANFTVNEVLEISRKLGVPKEILHKEPNDGLSGNTDEEKMGVKYSQIEEMIEKGETDKQAKDIILKMNKISKHKREKIPVYYFERNNYLK